MRPVFVSLELEGSVSKCFCQIQGVFPQTSNQVNIQDVARVFQLLICKHLVLQGNIRLRGPTSLFQAWLLETCQVARAETDLMVPWVSKKVLSDMRSGFGDFPPRNEDTYLVFIRKPNDPLFKERLSKSSSSWGTYQCTETVIFLAPQNQQNLAGMLT